MSGELRIHDISNLPCWCFLSSCGITRTQAIRAKDSMLPVTPQQTTRKLCGTMQTQLSLQIPSTLIIWYPLTWDQSKSNLQLQFMTEILPLSTPKLRAPVS